MERACHHGKRHKEGGGGVNRSRAVHKMHSFERRIKSENQHKNPDLDENLPSYMRQTCSSLCKRNSFRVRDFEGHDVRCCRQREGRKSLTPREHSRKSLTPRSDGKRTPRKNCSCSHEGVKSAGRRGRSRSLDGKSFCSSSPRSELSMVEEATEDDGSMCSTFDLSSKKSLEITDGGSSPSELTSKPSLETIDDETSSQTASEKTEEVPEDGISERNSETVIESVISIEPKVEGNEMSSLMEECFESVIHDALTAGKASLVPEPPDVRETIVSEEAFSEAGVEDSCCLGSDSDDAEKPAVDLKSENATVDLKSEKPVVDLNSEKPAVDLKSEKPAVDLKSEKPAVDLKSDLFRSDAEDVQPPTPHLETSAKLETGNSEDVFEIMEEAKWIEDDSDSEENEKLKSHQLNDVLLGSFTDSEFGDEYAQLLIDKHHGCSLRDKGTPKLSSNSNGFNVRFPAQDSVLKETEDKTKIFERCDSDKLAKADGSYQIRGHGLLWMLGGNLLAGVVGAAIASAGLPMGSHGTGGEVEAEISSPRSDGACADDWFFQASSHVSPDE